MIIDVFCHIHPFEFLKELRERCKALSFEHRPDNGYTMIINKKLGFMVGYVKGESHFSVPELRLRHMDKYGIDVQVLSVALPGTEPAALSASPEDTLKIAKVVNDAISGIAERHPERFIGVAEVPVLVGGEAVDELERAVGELGLRAIQLYTQMGGVTLDSPALYPIYEKAVKYDIPILVHPTNPPQGEYRKYERDFFLYFVFGWPYETSLALGRIVFSGLLDEFPKLKFISHHLGGGMIPFHAGRIAQLERDFKGGYKASSPLLEYFKKNMYHDTAVNGNRAALMCGYEFFGAERIVFATDYPFGPQLGESFMRENLKIVKELGITQEEKEKILERNARELFKMR